MALDQAEFNELLASTVEKIEKTLVDQVMTAHPTLDLFKKNVKSATGLNVVVPVSTTLGTTKLTDASGSFYDIDGGSNNIAAVDGDVVSSVKYTWSNPIVSKVRVQWADLQQNSGPEAVVALAKAHLDSSIGGHAKFLADGLHRVEGDALLTAGHFLTLDQLVGNGDPADANAAYGVGGIAQTTFATVSFAKSAGTATVIFSDPSNLIAAGDKVRITGLGSSYDGVRTAATISGTTTKTITFATTSGTDSTTSTTKGRVVWTFDASASGAAQIKDAGYWTSSIRYIPDAGGTDTKDIFQAFRLVSNDIFVASGKRPTAIVCGRDVYEEYENALDDAVRYTMMATAESRFQELKFDGMSVRLDPDAPAKRAYFLNENALIARYLNSNFMKVMPAQVVPGTLDTVTPLASVVAFGTSERRAHGLLVREAYAS